MTDTLLGRFVVLDGPEGAGKTLQVKRLVDRLNRAGRRATAVHDPGGPVMSQRIREVLLDQANSHMDERTETLLFMASRAELVAKIVRPALGTGLIVVSDRFTSATAAYQGYAGGMDLSFIWHLSKWACDGLEPQLTVILDVDVATGFKRIHGKQLEWDGQFDFGFYRDRMEIKPPAYHEKVRQGFLAMAAERPEAFVVVDATRPADAVAEDVWEAVQRVL